MSIHMYIRNSIFERKQRLLEEYLSLSIYVIPFCPPMCIICLNFVLISFRNTIYYVSFINFGLVEEKTNPAKNVQEKDAKLTTKLIKEHIKKNCILYVEPFLRKPQKNKFFVDRPLRVYMFYI